jgi:hypothetical protein
LVNIYPNPASDKLNIELLNDSKGQLVIMDLNGKVVRTESLNSKEAKDLIEQYKSWQSQSSIKS